MIVDTSAILAIIEQEPEGGHADQIITTANNIKMSAANAIECIVVLTARHGDHAVDKFYNIIEAADIEIVQVTESHMDIARDGFRRYGKGQGNASKLNLGDLFAYALAKETDDMLLFKGNDFIHTDLQLLRLDDTPTGGN